MADTKRYLLILTKSFTKTPFSLIQNPVLMYKHIVCIKERIETGMVGLILSLKTNQK